MVKPILAEWAKPFAAVKRKLARSSYRRCRNAFAAIYLALDPILCPNWPDVDRWTMPYHQGSELIASNEFQIDDRIRMRYAIFSDHDDALDDLTAVLPEITSQLSQVPQKFLPKLPSANWKFDEPSHLGAWLGQLLAFHWQCDINWRYCPDFLPATISAYLPQEAPPIDGVEQVADFNPQTWFLRPQELSEAIDIARTKYESGRLFPAALIASFSEDLETHSLEVLEYLEQRGHDQGHAEIPDGRPRKKGIGSPPRNKARLTNKQAAAVAIDYYFNPEHNPDYLDATPTQAEMGRAVGVRQKDMNIGLMELLPPHNNRAMTAGKKLKAFLREGRFDELLAIAHAELRAAGILKSDRSFGHLTFDPVLISDESVHLDVEWEKDNLLDIDENVDVVELMALVRERIVPQLIRGGLQEGQFDSKIRVFLRLVRRIAAHPRK